MKTLFECIDIKDALGIELSGDKIFVCGWIKTIRSSKSLSFIELSDGTCFESLQVIYDEKIVDFIGISKMVVGSAVVISGVMQKSQGSKQAIELKADEITLAGRSDSDYPLQKKAHSLEYLREIAHLRCRTKTFQSMFRLRSVLTYAIHKFFQEEGFTCISTPIITSSDAEGAGEVFKVTTRDLRSDHSLDSRDEFFGQEAGLAVSGQLEAEALVAAFKKVYSFGPVFRAEKSHTRRHLAEFWMLEPEIAFAKIDEVIFLIEKTVKYLISYILQEAASEIKFFDQYYEPGLLDKLQSIVSSDFAIISYTDAMKILQESDKSFSFKPEWGIPLQTEHERYLADKIFKKPVFVVHYPKEAKAFYMKLSGDGKTVAATDLLFPGIGEIVGASEREDSFDVLSSRILESGLKIEDYGWYLDLRRYGSVPHGGFGIGFERLIMYMSGVENIRDTIPFPRTPGKLEF
ncbi:MAG: asparagine--tRNA ligase [Bacilli bacterium]|nr:asparagine--tRNA ligase [Bacilli bacterium]